MKKIYAVTLMLLFLLAAQLQLSNRVSSAVQNPDPVSFASCGVRTNDIAIPTTGADIQDIVTRYVADPTCNSRLRTAIENIFTDEHRDEKWAGSLEQIVKEEALARGAKIAGVCHTSLCRYDIELNPSVESARSPHEVEHRIIAATAGTPLQVDSLQYYGSNFKFTIFFYSTVAPAAFLEPLRKQMEPAD
jgi:hypothetical protein